MLKGFFNAPQPQNEPVLGYAPGSTERAALKAALADARSRQPDIPMYIGGKAVRTGKTGEVRPPHDHQHLLATYQIGDVKEINDAINAALAAKAGHALLYLFLIALPLSGWYAASRLGVPVSFFGFQLPAITERVQGAPGLIADIHENAGTIILYLAGLHAAMAVWHQYVLRDGTLQRMSPR